MRGYIASRYQLANGVAYAPGDVVAHPEEIADFDIWLHAGYFEEADVPDPVPVEDLAKLKRDELNAVAAAQGVDAPETLPNKAAVIDVLTQPEPADGD